jgi:hypothetical protein
MSTMAELGDVDVVISDAGISEAARRELADCVRELHTAPVA